jgi:N-ethylmaleimide reductase
MQLWHQGRQSHSSFHNGELPVAPSAVKITQGHANTANYGHAEREIPRELTIPEIQATIEVLKLFFYQL